jgi:hypothetical protein
MRAETTIFRGGSWCRVSLCRYMAKYVIESGIEAPHSTYEVTTVQKTCCWLSRASATTLPAADATMAEAIGRSQRPEI